MFIMVGSILVNANNICTMQIVNNKIKVYMTDGICHDWTARGPVQEEFEKIQKLLLFSA